MDIDRREFGKTALGVAAALAFGAGRAEPGENIRKAIPSTGEQIPVVGLGTNRYGVGGSAEARAPLRAALQRFTELGGTVIDTAPAYRDSEAVLGDLIADLGIRSKLFLATKVDRDTRTASDARMHESLARLKAETIDLMQVHNLQGWRETLPLLRDWKQAGRIRYLGVTTSRISQYDELEHIMRAEELDFVQLDYSLEQREAAVRLLPLAADRGMAVMVNRALGGGRLFGTVGNRPLPDWAHDLDCMTWAQFLLKYAVSHPAVTVAIPGMTKVHHVDDDLAAACGRLPGAAERRRMEAFFDSL